MCKCFHTITSTKYSEPSEQYDILLNDNIYIEVKNRKIIDKHQFLNYINQGWMIQEDKYNFLQTKKQSRYFKYIYFEGDFFILSFNVNKITFQQQHKELSTTTEFENKIKKDKTITLLSTDYAKIYKRNWSEQHYKQITKEQLIKIINK
jgi:phage terminase large subunit GpA-like protein